MHHLYLRRRRHGDVAENVFYYLPHLPRVPPPPPPPALCSKFWAKTKRAATVENRTKMGGNKMDRLRMSSRVAAAAAVGQFFSANARIWMVL